MLEANKETVKVVFKHFPLRMHQQALPASIAAMAAFRQGKFWEYHDLIFASKNLTPDLFLKFAKDLNLDVEKFSKDMANPELQQLVARDMNDGREAGVGGTPSLFVGGRRVNSRALPEIQKLITQALEDTKKGVK